jgi:uncharacterized GH25 family protein
MRILLTFLFCGLGTIAGAHEFWISPQTYTVTAGETVAADIRIGQNFSGAAYAFNPSTFARFDIIRNGETFPATGILGDTPAMTAQVDDGLAIIVHETTPERLTYVDWEKFQKFVDHKDLGVTQADHIARGLPDTKFVERYVRYAKSLVKGGTGAGADFEVGLKTEIVAMTNPYTDDLVDGVSVRVLRDGAPRADAQVEIFAKQGDEVTVITTRTDADGIAVVTVAPNTEYLIDAVYLEPTEGDAVWQSYWASLTFQTPSGPCRGLGHGCIGI